MDYLLAIMVILAIYTVLTSSLNVVMGYGGLLSLAHAAFYAVGAYASALAALQLGWPVWASASAGMLAAGCLGGLLALPLLNLRGDYFILGSLGLQIIIVDAIHNSDPITNGPQGLAGIPRPSFLGFPVTSNLAYAICYGVLAGALVLLIRYFMASPFGTALNGVRDDEVAASSLGKNVRSIRVRAFAISAAAAGLAGAMYAHFVTFIDPTSFGFTESVYILSMVVVGGMGTTVGPLIGAALLVCAPEMLRFVGVASGYDANLRQVMYGVLLIAFAFLRPRGLAGRRIL